MSSDAPSRRRGRVGAAIAFGLVGVAGLAACSSSTSAGASGASPASGAAKAEVAAATTELSKYSAIPAFTAPGAAIDISSLKGKTIYSIPQSAAIPFLSATEDAEKKTAESLGINFVEYPTQGTSAEWIRGINQAIASKAAAILLNALDPRLVEPQIEAAKAAGIPVISEQFYDTTQVSTALSSLAGVRADNFTEAAKLEADYAIEATGGKADVVVVENTEQLSTQAMLTSMKAEFTAQCPACKVKYINVPSSDWATKIQTEVQSALVADSGVNYVIPIYDPMTQFVVPAITAAGKTGKIGIATFNGTPSALKMVSSGAVNMDIGENLDWLGSANLDEAFRAMLGQSTLTDEKTAMRTFTKENVSDTGNPPAYNLGFGTSYTSGYKTLWGVS